MEVHGLDILLYVVIVGIKDLRQDVDKHLFVVLFEELADVLYHLFSVLSVLVDHFEQQNVQRAVILLFIQNVVDNMFEKTKLPQQFLLFLSVGVQVLGQVGDPFSVGY